MTVVLLGGLITWLLTTILVESKITEPLRRFVRNRTSASVLGRYFHDVLSGMLAGQRVGDLAPKRRWYHRLGLVDKVDYLLNCHLCTGTWVGIALAFTISGPLSLLVLNGLAYKAVAHLILVGVDYLDRDRTPVVNLTVNQPSTDTHYGPSGERVDDDGSAWPDPDATWLPDPDVTWLASLDPNLDS